MDLLISWAGEPAQVVLAASMRTAKDLYLEPNHFKGANARLATALATIAKAILN